MKINKPKFWDKENQTFFSLMLLPFSYIYFLIITIKKYFKKEKEFPIPVICVGNIYVGGTGKTPVCVKLKNLLDDKRLPVVIKKKKNKKIDKI